jgi:aspartyl-tRNA synthetase
MCGHLRPQHVNQEVVLSGWVQRIRDKGHFVWVMLRDKTGETQLVFEEGVSDPALILAAKALGREFVVRIVGQVIMRESPNHQLTTGEVEVRVRLLEILNPSDLPPFTIETDTDGGEELRMQYRFLDLRRKPVHQAMLLRHRALQFVRNYLSDKDFTEIETPFLIKSTPEGARDFIVPSRLHPGTFYALPQSPQTFKQLLMVSGFDKYFQIVKCFRDEDFRADRQPEFTQIDCEMSFVDEKEIMNVFTGMVKGLFQHILGVDLGEFPILTYQEAMSRYGSDRPDLRFGMEIVNLLPMVQNIDFVPFVESIQGGGTVAGIVVPGGAAYSRKWMDELTEWVKSPRFGMKGLAWLKVHEDGTTKSSFDKVADENTRKEMAAAAGVGPNDMLLILAGAGNRVATALGELRLRMGKELNLRNKDVFAPCWVVDFPLVDWNEEEQRFDALHHPFTAPHPDDLDIIDKGTARSRAYDMVINGWEVGGGSIRIHDNAMQQRIFKLLGMHEAEYEAKFGFLLGALRFGAPPHGGLAFGFDRLCAMLAGTESIRDVIAFPKNNAGRDTMLDAPSVVDNQLLKDAGIALSSK